jgi:hypothetical protein
MELEDYSLEKLCSFKDESYLARDNGAVMRKSRFGKRIRQLDDKWSFGKQNKAGYMEFCGERVHIIVATAFHGDKPGEFHVVDHIDTNRCNNRPENLRWVTRLENALNNPITRRKIELICGSIENFLDDPTCIRSGPGNQNIEWMRRVSKEEADNCRENLTKWAESGQVPSGKGKLGEWVYNGRHNRSSLNGLDASTVIHNSKEYKSWRNKSDIDFTKKNDFEEFYKSDEFKQFEEGLKNNKTPSEDYWVVELFKKTFY